MCVGSNSPTIGLRTEPLAGVSGASCGLRSSLSRGSSGTSDVRQSTDAVLSSLQGDQPACGGSVAQWFRRAQRGSSPERREDHRLASTNVALRFTLGVERTQCRGDGRAKVPPSAAVGPPSSFQQPDTRAEPHRSKSHQSSTVIVRHATSPVPCRIRLPDDAESVRARQARATPG